ncbi:Uma2 family endonuclease [Synechococcus sp. PCC 7336]|uniref:Uma2 family endonuclease n=1 Tax=Synechococcus sp. PCC 7336 TaxID=195250 RepID=UPI00034B405B
MVTTQDPQVPEILSLPVGELYSDEPPMESDAHLRQMLLLISCLDWLWQDRDDYFASGNLTIYFSPKQIKSRDFRGPDFFVVLGTERRSRKSWVVWEEEGKYPNAIVEILSESTAQVDRGTKKQLYQDTFRTPEYFWFDPNTLEFAGFLLIGGTYEPISANEAGYLWSRQLDLYLGIHESQLRFFTPDEQLVPTPLEAAQQAQQEAQQIQQEAQQAQQEAQQAQQEAQQAQREAQQAQREVQQAQQRTDRLAAKLRELGLDPNTI